jgi:hypothetical protein
MPMTCLRLLPPRRRHQAPRFCLPLSGQRRWAPRLRLPLPRQRRRAPRLQSGVRKQQRRRQLLQTQRLRRCRRIHRWQRRKTRGGGGGRPPPTPPPPPPRPAPPPPPPPPPAPARRPFWRSRRLFLGSDSRPALGQKRHRLPSLGCCPALIRLSERPRWRSCGSGRRSRLSTSASVIGAPSWRSVPRPRPANLPRSGLSLSRSARTSRRT